MNDLQKLVNVHRFSERVNDFPTQLRKTAKLLFCIDTGVNGKGCIPITKKVGKIVHSFTRARGHVMTMEMVNCPNCFRAYVRFYVRRRVGGVIYDSDAVKLTKIAAS